jgi:branched-chain amino acid transport system substrate-binding protein
MLERSAVSRRGVLTLAAGALAAPAVLGRAQAATRGVSDTEIIIGMMTDLSGVTAVQGSNAANAIRMAFDDVNAKGGLHGRKIRFIVEDDEYLVPKAVQAMNKLINRDNVFFVLGGGGTPHMDAVLPSMIEKQVPSLFALTCARSMYEPLNRYKFGQFSSYYDQMRAAVKYFAEQRGRKKFGAMYQDTDFGKDVFAGAMAQAEAMGIKLAAVTAHRPTDTDFNAPVTRLQEAGCDAVMMGTIVKDTTIILQTARKMGFNAEFCGNFASYSTAVAEAPGGPAEGFYSMSPALYRYPDDERPAVRTFAQAYKKRFGIDPNYLGEAGYTGALFTLAALDKAGRDLTLDSFITALESMKDWRDIFDGPALSLSPTNHHASSQSFLSIVKNARWVPVEQAALGY